MDGSLRVMPLAYRACAPPILALSSSPTTGCSNEETLKSLGDHIPQALWAVHERISKRIADAGGKA
jgi:hypothetical protein